jgi:hypothetical protein
LYLNVTNKRVRFLGETTWKTNTWKSYMRIILKWIFKKCVYWRFDWTTTGWLARF